MAEALGGRGQAVAVAREVSWIRSVTYDLTLVRVQPGLTLRQKHPGASMPGSTPMPTCRNLDSLTDSGPSGAYLRAECRCLQRRVVVDGL
ncbi:hypothetical protein GZL_01087 [Streptomyces sp. 769]|nr:hypothetical protein GZL_01087 [Streptomyces sp. 769]